MQLTITRPDDWHLHLRDGSALAAVLPLCSPVRARYCYAEPTFSGNGAF
jgi:dihydroorotase